MKAVIFVLILLIATIPFYISFFVRHSDTNARIEYASWLYDWHNAIMEADNSVTEMVSGKASGIEMSVPFDPMGSCWVRLISYREPGWRGDGIGMLCHSTLQQEGSVIFTRATTFDTTLSLVK